MGTVLYNQRPSLQSTLNVLFDTVSVEFVVYFTNPSQLVLMR